MSTTEDKSLAKLEMEANRVRSRLLDTLERLDRKRHEITNVRLQVREHAPELAAVGGALALLLGGSVLLAVLGARRHERKLREERVRAIGRFWRHPEWLAQKKRSSLAGEIGRKVLVGMVTFAAIELAKRGVRRALVAPAVPRLPHSTVRVNGPSLPSE